MTSKVRASLAAGVFCLGVLATMLVGHAWPLWTGETIYLRVVPVDPRDLFRGDYVTLRYPINSLYRTTSPTPLPPGQASTRVRFDDHWATGDRAFYASRPVYVTLERREGAAGAPVEHVAVAVSTREPDAGLFIRGRGRWYSSRTGPPEAVDVDYGIDAFFVEEGRGRAIEREIRQGKPVLAEVAVSSSGRARLRTLIINGQRYRPAE